ncbi:major facilitator superfamily domain-containing protein [Cytidiella melzeri]|nr:major facilitator superfamily domain-containing protein [Cytidiella melzeri]
MAFLLYRYLKKKYDNRRLLESNAPTLHEITGRDSGQVIASAHHVDGDPAPSATKADLVRNLLLMVGLIIPVFLETLDYTVVATAQVHIASIFNRLDLQSYIGTIYLLTSTVFLPPFASIADIFGRHWALQAALVFFAIGSALSTGAQNMPMMLAGRGVAGIGAAGLLAVVRIILTDSRSLDANNWQQTLLFLLYTVGFCIGPFIGGELLTVSFRWIFAINLPCCAAAVVLAFFLLRGRTKSSQPSQKLPTATNQNETFLDKVCRIDWIGALLFMAGGILILLALNWGSTNHWKSAKVIVCFIIGGLAICAFLLWEYHIERTEHANMSSKIRLLYTDPMIPLDIFKSRDICIVMYATMISGLVMLVMFYFVAIFFIVVSDLSPTKSGAQLIYFAPGMGGGSLISINLIKWIRQPKYPTVAGALISTVALGLISFGINENNQSLVNGFMALAGVGTGLQVGPLAVQARFSQPAKMNAAVSGLLLFFRALGGTIGLAQCGAVLNGKVSSYIATVARSGGLSNADAQAVSLSSAAGLNSVNGIDNLPADVQQIVRDAFRQGTRYAFISLIPWCAVAFIAVLFMSRIPDGDRGVGVADSTPLGDKRVNATEEKEEGASVATPRIDAGPYESRPTALRENYTTAKHE